MTEKACLKIHNSSRKIELLAPARDFECGAAAIDCGADAVYIGPARFGAREAAGNSVEDIARLAQYAHQYWAKVYATINTLLKDDELPAAVELAWRLHEAGVDGLIIQDTGLLESKLPPLPLIASTQMNNATPAKVAFLEAVGFRRAILARELSLEQIKEIRAAAPGIELECFVHGALCVGTSGQCYLSFALGGRSGNRGACAQPCRKRYDLLDAQGRKVIEGKHLLSLKDLNLTHRIGDLLAAGVTAFKIEGRLKDAAYVANVTAHYRAILDEAMKGPGLGRRSSGASRPGFVPDVNKTFNRGYSTYFLKSGMRNAECGVRRPEENERKIGSLETPKMVGERLGAVKAIGKRDFTLETDAALHAGDGLCWFGRDGQLRGATVNAARGRIVEPGDREALGSLERGTIVYRNHDHEFLMGLKKARRERRIGVQFNLKFGSETPELIQIEIEDEDGVRSEAARSWSGEAAAKPEQALDNLKRQLAKTGGTIFECGEVRVDFGDAPVPFLPVAEINALRREALEALAAERERRRERPAGGVTPNAAPYPERELSFKGNVLNRRAEAFYRRHGVERIESAAETGLSMRGRIVMTTKYCLKRELGWCPRFLRAEARTPNAGPNAPAEPLTLVDEEGNRLRLRFRCDRCEMDIELM